MRKLSGIPSFLCILRGFLHKHYAFTCTLALLLCIVHRTRLPNLNGAMAATLKPLKIAILGGGPSSFYCASRILSKLPRSSPEGQHVQVHVYDRLWAPHGLVRYGVAPDHPEVKVRILSKSLYSPTDFLRINMLCHPMLDGLVRRIAHTNLMRQRKTLASGSLGMSTSVIRPPSRTPCIFHCKPCSLTIHT